MLLTMAKTIELTGPITKETFDNCPNLRTVYLANYEIEPDTIPNRRLVLFFPKDYSHKIVNVPMDTIVVIHAESDVVDRLSTFYGGLKFFVWRDDSFWPQGEGMFSFHSKHNVPVQGFQDPEYDTKKNWIVGVRNDRGYSPLAVISFLDYWIHQDAVMNAITSMGGHIRNYHITKELDETVDHIAEEMPVGDLSGKVVNNQRGSLSQLQMYGGHPGYY